MNKQKAEDFYQSIQTKWASTILTFLKPDRTIGKK